MGIKERKQREKEQRRRAIVDAAEAVIFEKGLEQATMDEIAEEAELSKGTLYLYFTNKTELYLAICKRGSNILNRKFAKVFANKDRTGIELIRNLGETYLNFVIDNPDYFNAFIHYETLQNVGELENSETARVCEENVREAMSFTVRALQIGMQDGTIDNNYDPRELAVLIWGSTRGMIQVTHMKEQGHHLKIVDEMDLDIKNMFKGFLNLIGKGLQPEQEVTEK